MRQREPLDSTLPDSSPVADNPSTKPPIHLTELPATKQGMEREVVRIDRSVAANNPPTKPKPPIHLISSRSFNLFL